MGVHNFNDISRILSTALNKQGSFPAQIIKMSGAALSYLFKNRSFYLQSRMHIDKRSPWNKDEFVQHIIKNYGGFFLPDDTTDRKINFPYPWDSVRRDMLVLLMKGLLAENVEGDFAELGVYRGGTAKLFHYYAPERKLHLFDTFSGFDGADLKLESKETGYHTNVDLSKTGIEAVRQYINPLNNNVVFHQGFFPDSIPDNLQDRKFAFVHLDADLLGPTQSGLEFFYPRMPRGGVIVVHDYNGWPGARKAVKDFLHDKLEQELPYPDKSGSAVIKKI